MVDRIEQYNDTLKVILKPTRKYPVGYFYCDSEDEDLVKSHTWFIRQCNKNIRVEARNNWKDFCFNQELALKYLGYYPDYLDHLNGVDIDNVDNNLNIVTQQQNMFNTPVRGYDIRSSSFYPRITYNKKIIRPFGVCHSELEACRLTYLAETDYLRSLMQDDYYMYDFLKDRRDDLDILDKERTKKISSEEATYKHVMRYAKDNAWYYYRYNLAEYFKDNHIPVPDYDLDDKGSMIDKITGKRLCPF